MIDVALLYIRDVLDQYLVNRLGVAERSVILHGLSSADSGQLDTARNKVAITLIGLEHESNKQFYGGMRSEGHQVAGVNPSIYFNLGILISVNFDSYAEALKQLTCVIGFFQATPSMDRVSYPAMPDGLVALKFEIENSPPEKMHNVWTALGVSYLPSIIYKVRHVVVQSGQVTGKSAVVQGAPGVVVS